MATAPLPTPPPPLGGVGRVWVPEIPDSVISD
jgi:hypothetical protein